MLQFTQYEYLKELLCFAAYRIQFVPNGQQPSGRACTTADLTPIAEDLHLAFHQPFDRLVDDDNAINRRGTQPIERVRLAVEILRKYAKTLSVEAEEVASAADDQYLKNAYQMFLRNIGTSYEELRLVRAATNDQELREARERLLERLGFDSVERLGEEGLFIKPEDVTLEKLEKRFGIISPVRDPFSEQPDQPEILTWYMDRLRMLWRDRDSSANTTIPLMEPDLIHEALLISEDQAEERPYINSTLIDIPDTRTLAHTLWSSRRDEIDGWIAAVEAQIDEAVSANPQNLQQAFDNVVRASLGDVDLETLLAVRTQEEAGDALLEGQQRVLDHLDLGAHRRLVRLRKLAGAGILLEPEKEDIKAILVQFKKRERYPGWLEEELEEEQDGQEPVKRIFLSPDFFTLPSTVQVESQALDIPHWRISLQARREWEDTLRARTDQMQTVGEALRSVIDATERVTLDGYRDDLLAAIVQDPTVWDSLDIENVEDLPTDEQQRKQRILSLLADKLTKRLLVDFRNAPGRKTTRLDLAIRTLQSLFFELRMERSLDQGLPDPQSIKDWQLVPNVGNQPYSEEVFDQEWRWFGAHTTRRTAEFVREYPEIYLLPSLRTIASPGQTTGLVSWSPTGAFRRLVENLRLRSRLTPGQARQLANEGIGAPGPDNMTNAGYWFLLRSEGAHLFSVTFDTLDDIVAELDEGRLPQRIKAGLLEFDSEFTAQTVVVEEAGHKWSITDGDSKYSIRRENSTLAVYQQLSDSTMQSLQALGTPLITDQLSTEQIKERQEKIIEFFGNPNNPHHAPYWVQEIFYFVPTAIALQLQRAGHYLEALDWYQTVYAYQLPWGHRKIYPGLEKEQEFPDHSPVTIIDWVRLNVDPHHFARIRKNSYTRFTVMSIVQCLLDYADSEFTRQTEESLDRARSLYLTALELLDIPELKRSNEANGTESLANPMLVALRDQGELNLQKLRSNRNIAGMQRPPQPEPSEESETSDLSDMPVIGAGGQIVVSTPTPPPTLYRYPVLIERARQLVNIAQQMEAAYLSAMEKQDASDYSLRQAKNDFDLSKATVELQKLRESEAETAMTLAQAQEARIPILRDTYQGWIDNGETDWESKMLFAYQEAGDRQVDAATWAANAAIAQALTVAATAGTPGARGAAALGAGAVTTAALFGKDDTQAAIRAQTRAQIASVRASFERRKQEWELQVALADQDDIIASKQVTLAQDQQRIVAEEKAIAEIRQVQSDAMVKYLENKFLSEELYQWMASVLSGVYNYFLQQATSMALLAQSQLAFERQEKPPSFILADYWVAPVELGSADRPDSEPRDRRGLTGSTRLLQDIYKLDQYAFETRQRKLQLTQTLSLAQLFPYEFQQFRETGKLPFTTHMELFDEGFPGHYLRLIKRVRVSVVALIPPTRGIRATLSTGGISHVVVGPDIFRKIDIVRDPELIAFTSPSNATGLFELEQEGEMLLPFEGTGVDTGWELEMPRPANPFDYRSIADVLLTIEYTALHSHDYRHQLLKNFNPRIDGERSFSLRDEFPDQWYDLQNPEQVEEAERDTVTFRTRRGDFPPNITDQSLKIKQLLLYFNLKSDDSEDTLDGHDEVEFEIESLHLNDQPIGDRASSIKRVISTRRNALDWQPLYEGKSPVGEWKLTLNASEDAPIKRLEDILFVITYDGITPPWPT